MKDVGLELPASSLVKLDQYAQVLWGWNQRLNLTRHTDYEAFVIRDLVDTLEVSKLIHPDEHVLDIGSGGGVPGIPLAIIRPDLSLTICDSVGKKAKALQAMVDSLGLQIEVYAERAETLLDDFSYDVCTARAVGPLWKLCRWLDDHWLAAGRLLAIKGPRWVDERSEAREKGMLNKLQLRCAAEYETPLIGAKNYILKLWAKSAPEK